MPAQKRYPTDYPGVYYIIGQEIGTGKPERVYYIMYRKDGKQIHEKAGRAKKDDMSPAKAAKIRVERMSEGGLSNQAKRKAEETQKKAEADRWTIKRLWEEYKSGNPGLKGFVTDENRYKNHIDPVFGAKEPHELAPLDIDRLRLKLLKTKSPGTVKNVLELLRRIINFGVKKNLCQGVKFIIEMPRLNNEKTEDLSPEQLQALLKAIEEEPSKQVSNLMKLALYTGMRRGELFRLKWEDIDERGFIHIREPKGGVDQKIPLNEAARQIFESHERTGSEFVFPGRGGHQRVDIIKQVNRIKERAGLPKSFRALHGLRHVYASMLASSGKVDMYTLQKLLTHKGPQMTQRYAHLRDETLRDASDLAGEIIGEAIKKADDKKLIEIKNRQ